MQCDGARICILVAGMHRSGTSATTRVVNLLGADITNKLAPAQPGINDRGFWESTALFPIHDELMHDLGSSWDDPFPLPDRWRDGEAARRTRGRIIAEIDAEFADSRLFVVKDPRLARLLPLWSDICDELHIEPIIVIPFRNPLEVALSLAKRDRMAKAKSILMYVHSYLEVELASRGLTRVLVHYDALLDDWRVFAERLRHAASPRIPVPSAKTMAAIDDFLVADLHRNRSSRKALGGEPEMAAMVAEIYDHLTEAASRGDDGVLRIAFDRLRGVVSEAAKLHKGLILAEKEESRRKLDAIEAGWRSELATMLAHAAEMDAALLRQTREVSRLNEELAGMRERASRMEADIRAGRVIAT